jgi:hypothetical protein
MSVGVLDLRVVAGKVGEDLCLHPSGWCSTTAAPVVGGGYAAPNRGGDVACAVWLDESAEACLIRGGGHGCMVGDSERIAMPNFWVRGCSGFLNNRAGGCGWFWGVMFATFGFLFFFLSSFYLYVLFFLNCRVENITLHNTLKTAFVNTTPIQTTA